MSEVERDLRKRHLTLGFFGLALYGTLGLVLEGLHGFKADSYLNVANETRRLMWRLSHAHGTLLSLVQIAFGLAATSTAGRKGSGAGLASRLLSLAWLLMPLGFFLGGWMIQGSDPGLGIILVPLGALAFISSMTLTTLALRRA